MHVSRNTMHASRNTMHASRNTMHVSRYTINVLRLIVLFLLISSQGILAQPADNRASAIADSVMLVMGGKENWDKVHYLKWNFFGRRTLYWDKWTGDVRIEQPSRKLLLLSNINTKQGHAYRDGKEITLPDSVTYFMDRAYKILINDSYWLIMPFKLKDPGVNLTYIGTAKDSANHECYLLQLTFNKVGVTPENKYHVWVDRKTYLVSQWAYFDKFTDTTAEIINSWGDYKWYQNVLISGDRGSEGKLTDIAVLNEMPRELFEKP